MAKNHGRIKGKNITWELVPRLQLLWRDKFWKFSLKLQWNFSVYNFICFKDFQKKKHHYIPKTQSFVFYCFTTWNIFDKSPSWSKSEKRGRWKRDIFLRSYITKLFLEPQRWQRLSFFNKIHKILVTKKFIVTLLV